MIIYSSCPLHRTTLVSAFQCSLATLFADEACKTIIFHWKNGKLLEDPEFFFLHCMFAAISQVSTYHLCAWGPCVGVSRAMALVSNDKQARGKGKGGLVETGLTGLVAMALYCPSYSTVPWDRWDCPCESIVPSDPPYPTVHPIPLYHGTGGMMHGSPQSHGIGGTVHVNPLSHLNHIMF